MDISALPSDRMDRRLDKIPWCYAADTLIVQLFYRTSSEITIKLAESSFNGTDNERSFELCISHFASVIITAFRSQASPRNQG